MGTFIGQLVGFAVILYVIWRWVVPPVRNLMAKQQQEVRDQLEASEKAKKKLADAERAHEKAVARARVEAAKIRDDARADAQRISEQLREQADAEVARIRQNGQEQIALQRAQLIRSLQADLGSAAVTEADRIVREQMANPTSQAHAVDRFLDELEAMSEQNSDRKGTA